jgi:pyrimidine-nucleoside phosphorylase
MAEDCLISGRALKIFEQMCEFQSGQLNHLKLSSQKLEIKADVNGYLTYFNVEQIGVAGILLRAGRRQTSDIIHPTSGIEFHKKINSEVKKGEVIYTIHGDEPELFQAAKDHLITSFKITENRIEEHQLIKKVLT